jgi:hypothetical protein
MRVMDNLIAYAVRYWREERVVAAPVACAVARRVGAIESPTEGNQRDRRRRRLRGEFDAMAKVFETGIS